MLLWKNPSRQNLFKKGSLAEKTWKEYQYTWNKYGREALLWGKPLSQSSQTLRSMSFLSASLKETYSQFYRNAEDYSGLNTANKKATL